MARLFKIFVEFISKLFFAFVLLIVVKMLYEQGYFPVKKTAKITFIILDFLFYGTLLTIGTLIIIDGIKHFNH